MSKVFGIRGSSYRGVNAIGGIGIEHSRSDDGWIGITGQANDVVTIACPFAAYQLGIWAQAVGSAVTLEFSLCSPSLLYTPDFQDNTDYWVKSTSITPGDITQITWTFSVVKVKFTAPAELYLVAR